MTLDQPAVHRREDLPLHGVRVVEIASFISVPLAGSMLRHLGAIVLKVEPASGDAFRRFGLTYRGMSATWANANQGKRSRFLDLKSAEGRGELDALLETADVVLQNLRPEASAALGLDGATLASQFPRLIQVALSGYGDSGPKSSLPVFDGLIQAATGMAAAESDVRPLPTRAYVVDKISALFVTQSVLAALVARETTGRGSRVDLAMLDIMAFFNFPDHGQDRTFLPPAPLRDEKPARGGFLRAADGYIAVVPVAGRHVLACLDVVGHPEWRDRLKACPNTVELTALLYELMESETQRRPVREWEALFKAHDVPATGVLSFDQHLADPQTLHNRIYAEEEGPLGPMRTVRYPARIDGRYLPTDPTWDDT